MAVLALFQRQVSVQKKAFYNKLFVNRILEHASASSSALRAGVGEETETSGAQCAVGD